MFGGFDFGPDVLAAAGGADEEGDAVGALVFSAHEGFFSPDAIGLDDGVVGIREEGEG